LELTIAIHYFSTDHYFSTRITFPLIGSFVTRSQFKMVKPVVVTPPSAASSSQPAPKKQKKVGKEMALQMPALNGKEKSTRGLAFLKKRPGQD
jgi:hypothetical protein